MAKDGLTEQKKHGLWADTQALLFGSGMCALGVHMLTSLGLVTGQTAGLAILLSYVTGASFGLVFFLVNLPFYWLGYRRMGAAFTIKTLIAVGLLSGFSALLPGLLIFEHLDMLTGSILLGMISGAGLLALFRHGASLGGVGIVALFLQDRYGFRAGYTQILVDALIFSAALFVIPWEKVAFSVLGALVINLTIAVNHRRDWYVAT